MEEVHTASYLYNTTPYTPSVKEEDVERIDEKDFKMDPILTAGTAAIGRIIEWASMKKAKYRNRFKSFFDEDGNESKPWCGMKDPKKQQSTGRGFTRKSFKGHLDQLTQKYRFVDGVSKCQRSTGQVLDMIKGTTMNKRKRNYAAFFLVPKSTTIVKDEEGNEKRVTLARVIISCKAINRKFAKPPKFKMATPERIFKCMKKFENPASATLDFRHWFYQIGLPKNRRHHFSLRWEKNSCYEFKVLPMGFSWSPWVAQTTTMATLYETRYRFNDESESPQDEVVEAVVTVKNAVGQEVAYMMGYLDNILIIAEDIKTRDELSDILRKVLEEANIVVKGSTTDQKRKEQAEDAAAGLLRDEGRQKGDRFAGWEFCPAKVTGGRAEGETTAVTSYMGIQMDRRGDGLWWKHLDKNIEKWKKKAEKLNEPKPCYKDVASIIGITLYDDRVRGQQRCQQVDLIYIASKVGRIMARPGRRWSSEVDDSEIDDKVMNSLKQFWAGIEERGWQKAVDVQKRRVFDKIYYIACDSSDSKAAAVLLTKEGGEMFHHVTWSKEVKESRSINWKETKVAIEAINILRERDPTKNIGFVIAEDNSTAVSSLNAMFYRRCPELCGDFLQLFSDIGGGAIFTSYENTLDQPADEPSRCKKEDFHKGSKEVNWEAWQRKCRKSFWRLRTECDWTDSKRERENEIPSETEVESYQ